MIDKKINKTDKKIRVLIAPLDWGLGHATRCIPLIRQFQAQGCEVVIAAEREIKALLIIEFQYVTFISLKGYHVRYSKQKFWLPFKLILQIPKIFLRICKEHIWLKKVVKKYMVNAVVSDNRFGLYHAKVPSIYITHQLLVKTGSRFTEKIIKKVHFWFIKKYSMCWVPDVDAVFNIAGELSHPFKYPSNIRYIGGLSRFEKKNDIPKKYGLLLLLSGPEPQRSIFEKLLLDQLDRYNGSVLLVRGLPGMENKNNTLNAGHPNGLLVIKNHLDAKQLSEAILGSELVICRSGYTTIMDLIALEKNAVLVPTPGQTEQEYLACHLMKQHLFYTMPQKDFLLLEVLKNVAAFTFKSVAFNMEQYKKTVTEFVSTLY